jgi:hypothetical protein
VRSEGQKYQTRTERVGHMCWREAADMHAAGRPPTAACSAHATPDPGGQALMRGSGPASPQPGERRRPAHR